MVRKLLRLAGEPTPEGAASPGFVIGKIENVLVLALVALGAYTALGLVFAAKGLIRKDTGEAGHQSYYVLGTLANFTWSLPIGITARWLAGT